MMKNNLKIVASVVLILILVGGIGPSGVFAQAGDTCFDSPNRMAQVRTPTENFDGTPLTDLHGVRVEATYEGSSTGEIIGDLETTGTGILVQIPCVLPRQGRISKIAATAYNTCGNVSDELIIAENVVYTTKKPASCSEGSFE